MTTDAPTGDDPVITPDDIRNAGHCALGFRDWLAEHGLDMAAFFRGEYRASDFLATKDANAIRVVDVKLGRARAEIVE